MNEQRRPLTVHGWTIYAHPLFLDQIEALVAQVKVLRRKDPSGYLRKNPAKRLAAIYKLAFEVIPQDPKRAEYRQGNTLGRDQKHWFRAKFFQQYRLFFRFDLKARVIVYAWINDATSRRAYGSASDAYRVFRKMLDSGHPPTRWDRLLAEAKAESRRLKQATNTD